MKTEKKMMNFKLSEYQLREEEENQLQMLFKNYNISYDHILKFSLTEKSLIMITQNLEDPIRIFSIEGKKIYHLKTIDVYYNLEKLSKIINNLKANEIFFSFYHIENLDNGGYQEKEFTAYQNASKYLSIADHLELLKTDNFAFQTRFLKVEVLSACLDNFILNNPTRLDSLNNFLEAKGIIPKDFNIFENKISLSEILKNPEVCPKNSLNRILNIQAFGDKLLVALKSEKIKKHEFADLYYIEENHYFKIKKNDKYRKSSLVQDEKVPDRSCFSPFSLASQFCRIFSFDASKSPAR